MSVEARLTCDCVSKSYRSAAGVVTQALHDISFSVVPGEFVAVVGSSGSGKSTLLRILADIEQPTSGVVRRRGLDRDGLVGMVFQGESVFPWRTVRGNFAYSLQARGLDAACIQRRPVELCELVGLPPATFLNKYPRELSGGEARRVAIGVALSTEASLLLFDEATSQLDYVSRLHLQGMIHELWLAHRPATVYVTHDIDEAIRLGQRVIVLREGRIVEILNVDLPIPRARDYAMDPKAQALRSGILAQLEV